jgi:hypothetical protein
VFADTFPTVAALEAALGEALAGALELSDEAVAVVAVPVVEGVAAEPPEHAATTIEAARVAKAARPARGRAGETDIRGFLSTRSLAGRTRELRRDHGEGDRGV